MKETYNLFQKHHHHDLSITTNHHDVPQHREDGDEDRQDLFGKALSRWPLYNTHQKIDVLADFQFNVLSVCGTVPSSKRRDVFSPACGPAILRVTLRRASL